MKINAILAENFGSYHYISYLLDKQGTILISGPTGAGKSTFLNTILWAFLGKTKKGSTNDFLPWFSIEETKVELNCTFNKQNFSIIRTKSKSKNDLHFYFDKKRIHGKNIKDTQEKLEQALGVPLETLLLCYYSEFSTISDYFTVSASERRNIINSFLDINIFNKLKEKCDIIIKDYKKQQDKIKTDLISLRSELKILNEQLLVQKEHQKKIKAINAKKLKEAIKSKESFDQTRLISIKAKKQELETEKQLLRINIEELTKEEQKQDIIKSKIQILNTKIESLKQQKCSSCNSPLKTKEIFEIQNDINLLQSELNKIISITIKISNLKYKLSELESNNNIYIKQIKYIENQLNPYVSVIDNIKNASKEPKIDFKSKIEQIELNINTQQNDLSLIDSKLSTYLIIKQSTDEAKKIYIQESLQTLNAVSNDLLLTKFESDIKIQLSIEPDTEDINLSITKDNNECSYYQLSKGQRQTLKLCFYLGVLAQAQNTYGFKYLQLFLDEVLTGMDTDTSIKALDAINSLEYYSTYIIDHNPVLKSMFDNELKINNNNGISSVEEN